MIEFMIEEIKNVIFYFRHRCTFVMNAYTIEGIEKPTVYWVEAQVHYITFY